MIYGHQGTIHRTQKLNIEIDKRGGIVSVWFRCCALPFDVRVVDEPRAIEMANMSDEVNKQVKLNAVDIERNVRNMPQSSEKPQILKIEESDNIPCDEIEENPYFVEVDDNGCSKCGAGRNWVVVNPDGIRGGTSYGLIEDAEDLAEDLNTAFNRGKNSKNKGII